MKKRKIKWGNVIELILCMAGNIWIFRDIYLLIKNPMTGFSGFGFILEMFICIITFILFQDIEDKLAI